MFNICKHKSRNIVDIDGNELIIKKSNTIKTCQFKITFLLLCLFSNKLSFFYLQLSGEFFTFNEI